MHLQLLCDTKSDTLRKRLRRLNTNIQSERSPRRPALAVFAAALIVFVQLAGAAHFHGFSRSQNAAQAELAAASELCALCLACHIPVVAAPSQASVSTPILAHAPAAVDAIEPAQMALEDHFGRAPPASL